MKTRSLPVLLWRLLSTLPVLAMAPRLPAQPKGSNAAVGESAVAAEAANALGVNLLRAAGSSNTNANALISPYSIQSALAMAYAGASGATREEMARVLHYPGDEATVHASFSALRDALDATAARASRRAPRGAPDAKPPEGVSLNVVNRLFGQQGYAFLQPFLTLVGERYRAPLQTVDFSGHWPEARGEINQWVAEQTRQRIRELIPPDGLNDQTRLVLVNAIHLKAPWQEAFPEAGTRQEPFHRLKAEDVQVPMMNRQGRFGHERHEDFSAITLPYLGSELQFLVLLPDAVDGLPALESRLTAERLKACSNPRAADVHLHLPKLKLQPPLLRLGRALMDLGMKGAFDVPRGSSNFERMAPRRPDDYLRISEVFHQTFLELDEKGTEAAAATAVSMVRVTSAVGPKPQPIEVRVDHPFLFAIQHRPSGTCLFLGRIIDPR